MIMVSGAGGAHGWGWWVSGAAGGLAAGERELAVGFGGLGGG